MLLSVVLASNCFEGVLPDTICHGQEMQQLILDGLHSATICTTKAMPYLPNSGLSSKHDVHGNLPACLLQLPNLTLLHIGGNSISGSIPNVPIPPNLNELVLASNEFTGMVPSFIWNSNITILDLSFNRLQGTLPSHMLPNGRSQTNINDSSTVIKLQVNQLAGNLPSFLQDLSNINILEGNLFNCKTDRSDLPSHDPKVQSYNCGSNKTDYGLLGFGGVLVFLTIVFMTISSYVRKDLKEWNQLFQTHYTGFEVSIIFKKLQFGVILLTSLCLVGMILFAILSVFSSSYPEVYVWTVSAIYKSGLVAAISMFFWFIVFVIWRAFGSHNQTTIPQPVLTLEGKHHTEIPSDKGRDIWAYVVSYMSLIINMVIMLSVNALYVTTTIKTNFTTKALVFITLGLSIFKIVWNYALVKESHRVIVLSDFTLLGACLFNNILAPLLAEMFASSDCFLYVITPAPSLSFDYHVYLCPTTAVFGDILPCSFPSLIAEGEGTVHNSAIPLLISM
jgi:hypothetical protein